MPVDVASLEKYRAAGMVQGACSHTAVRQVFPGATIWPLTRLKANSRSEEGLEWLGSLLFDTPFNVFRTADALKNTDAYYLVEETHRRLLARVTGEAVEARELPAGVDGAKLTVGEQTFRRYRRSL